MIEQQWLTIADAAELVGIRKSRRPTHYQTVRGWMVDGLRGVRLRSVMRGGCRMTTQQWLSEFFDVLNNAREREIANAPSRLRSPAAASKAQERAKRELEALGAR